MLMGYAGVNRWTGNKKKVVLLVVRFVSLSIFLSFFFILFSGADLIGPCYH